SRSVVSSTASETTTTSWSHIMSPHPRFRRFSATFRAAACCVLALLSALGAAGAIATTTAGPAAATPGSPLWANRWGGNTTLDEATGVVGDGWGNSYVVSDVLGTAVISGTTITTATQDVVVVMIKPNGTVGWYRVIGGSGAEHAGRIDVDNVGN